MTVTRKDIIEKLDEYIDSMMYDLEVKEGCEYGDIYPMQQFELSNHLERIAEILYAVLEQNIPPVE